MGALGMRFASLTAREGAQDTAGIREVANQHRRDAFRSMVEAKTMRFAGV
jgi:hypothetical protein